MLSFLRRKAFGVQPPEVSVNPLLINQSIIILTPNTKSLLPSLYKREEIPLFGKEGSGEILWKYVWPIMDALGSKVITPKYRVISTIPTPIPSSKYTNSSPGPTNHPPFHCKLQKI